MIKSFEDATFWDLVREAWEMPLRYQRMFWSMLGYTVVWLFAIFLLAVFMILLTKSEAASTWLITPGLYLLTSWIVVKWLRALAHENVDGKELDGNIAKPIIRVLFLIGCSYVVGITINAPIAIIGHSMIGGDSLVNYLIGFQEIQLTIGSLAYFLVSGWVGDFAYVLFLTAIVRAALGEPVKLYWPKFSVVVEVASYLFVVTLPFLLVGELAVKSDATSINIFGVIALFSMLPFAASASLIAYQRMGFSLPEKPVTDFQSYF